MGRRMRLRGRSGLALAAIVAAFVSGQPAEAQDAPAAQLPYEAEMLRLSEIMGALHYLRQLCDSGQTSDWRDEMQALIDAEQPDAERRARMIDRFNHGYESYRSVYRTCTPSAELAVQRYLDEGAKVAADIREHYGKHDGE
jgi:uncharacterized protein (TIGR02301 family)